MAWVARDALVQGRSTTPNEAWRRAAREPAWPDVRRGHPPDPVFAPTDSPAAEESCLFRRDGGGGLGPPPAALVLLEQKTSVDCSLAMAGLDHTPPASQRRGQSGCPSKDPNAHADATGSIGLAESSAVFSSALFFGKPKTGACHVRPGAAVTSPQLPEVDLRSERAEQPLTCVTTLS